ncbi:MAG: universal stress protein [Bacteroidales bacterium]|jgi:nucleotide-binding universal stress UspA family protein|nr:universal stress protein [Bacteroidales bacterium]
MKAIIVGIDFLNESLAALKLAVIIAVKTNSKITMVFVNKPEKSKPIFRTPTQKLKEEVENRFKAIVVKYSEKISGDRLSYVFREGSKIADVLNHEVELNNADLLVLGTQGKIGLKLFSHSLAFEIAETSIVPTITVRDGAVISNSIKKILVPIDDTLETRQKIPFSVRMAKLCGAEVHLIAIYHSSVHSVKDNVERYTRQSAEYLEKNNIDFVVKSIETNDVVNQTIKYATEINADIISIMVTQISRVSNIWKGSFAEQLIDQAPIPVIIVPSKELMRTLSR